MADDLWESDLYELLQVLPSATRGEIVAAYERLRSQYSPQSLSTYGLLSAEELDQIRTRLQAACEILTDPGRRRRYNEYRGIDATPVEEPAARETEDEQPVSTPPEPEPSPPPPVQNVAAPKPEAVENVDVEVEGEWYTGAVFKRYREAKGLELEPIADATKVAAYQLRAIEDHNFQRLPETVYVRGFLKSYLRELGIEEREYIDSYMALREEIITRKEKKKWFGGG